MADTKHGAAPPMPVEGDGVSYSGILWFVVILTITTIVCQVLMWGLFAVLRGRESSRDLARSPLAAPQGQAPPGPNLIAILPGVHGEPQNLKEFRDKEHAILTTYGWADQNTGAVRIPIQRAKDLLIERGLPTRPEVKK
jgi:hypothetical protein